MATITIIKDRINKLNQANFQILCDAILARKGYPGIVALGTKDGEAKTTPGTPDTYFCLCDGKYVFAEYTTQKKGLVAKIRSDIKKCLDEKSTKIPLCDIAEIVYCHTSSNISPANDRVLKSYCEEKGIKLTLIGIDSLAEMLMDYPIIMRDHLGVVVDSEQIQTLEDFVKGYNSNPIVATLETNFRFREKEYDAINIGFENNNVILLVGAAGIGKTRLALEFAKNHAIEHDEILLCIHDRSLPMYEDLKLYFENPGEYFVVIDDANQLSELNHVIEYVNKADLGYHVRVLMTVRDYAVSKVKLDINGIVNYETIVITPFTDEEIVSLMKEHYGIFNQVYLDRIVQIAEGNARIAMLAGKIARNANRLDAIYDVSDLYADYYGTVLRETGLESKDSLIITAGIMAFLNAIHLDFIDPIIPILEKKGLTTTDFVNCVHYLHEHEVVDICNDKGVQFSEQCMANYVLKYVFYDKKTIKLSAMIEACFGKYHERTVNAVNTLLGVFRNKDLQDYVENEILELWSKLENEGSPLFFDFLKTFFPVNEIKTLIVIKNLIDNEVPIIMEVGEIDTEKGKNYQSVNNEIITILGGFSCLENLETALDLFFQYYLKRPDLYLQFYHASTSFYSIDKQSAMNGYKTQITLFTKISDILRIECNPYIATLFCDVANHFLMLKFSPYENMRNGKGVTFYYLPLSFDAGVEKYRKLIWDQLLDLSSNETYSLPIKKVLCTYGNSIHDCSKEVINFDAKYISKLSKNLLSVDCLADCLIAQELQKTLKAAECNVGELQSFSESPKYKLYQIFSGPQWDAKIPYEEHKKRKEESIRGYILSTTNKMETVKRVLELLAESTSIENFNSYDITEGINIALRILANSKDDYLKCVPLFLSSETISGIDISYITETLFSMITPQEVYRLLSGSCQKHRNEWLYAYYCTIPQWLINKEVLDGLYEFLNDQSDCYINSSPYRDINFLNKYITVDENVVITASRIILKKKDYSPYMVKAYFGPQFNEHNIHPREVIQKYRQDIKLLEHIYLYVAERDTLADYQGSFLHELFETDKSFAKEYARWFVTKIEGDSTREFRPRVEAFFQEEDYIDILDYIANESITLLKYPTMSAPRIIKRLLDPIDDKNKEHFEKSDCWIRHQIENHCDDKDRMKFLFEALVDISLERTGDYIAFLVKCTDDYDIFSTIPLTPLSFSWTGSLVPVYSSWIDQLENLLPLFSGLKLIKHKDRVVQLIKTYREEIKKEEISDILNC